MSVSVVRKRLCLLLATDPGGATLFTQSRDTHPEIERVQIELLRQAGPQRRLTLGLSLSENVSDSHDIGRGDASSKSLQRKA